MALDAWSVSGHGTNAGTSLAHVQLLCRYPAEGFVTSVTKTLSQLLSTFMLLLFFYPFYVLQLQPELTRIESTARGFHG
jgi:hypothetical protein